MLQLRLLARILRGQSVVESILPKMEDSFRDENELGFVNAYKKTRMNYFLSYWNPTPSSTLDPSSSYSPIPTSDTVYPQQEGDVIETIPKKHKKKKKQKIPVKGKGFDHRKQCLFCQKKLDKCHCKRGKKHKQLFSMFGLSL